MSIFNPVKGLLESATYLIRHSEEGKAPSWCQLDTDDTQISHLYPHLEHAHKHATTTEIVSVCNTISDYTRYTILQIDNLSTELNKLSENQKLFREKTREKWKNESLGQTKYKSGVNLSEQIKPHLDGQAKAIVNYLEKKILNQNQNTVNSKELIQYLDNQTEVILSNLEEKIDKEFSKENLRMFVIQALDEQNRDLKDEIAKIKLDVRKLLKEVIPDPNNPNQTEVRIEKLSEQILKVSENAYPAIEKCIVLLERVEKALGPVARFFPENDATTASARSVSTNIPLAGRRTFGT